MKNILFVLLVAIPTFAQHGKVGREVAKRLSQNSSFMSFEPLAVNKGAALRDYLDAVDGATIARINPAVLEQIVLLHPENIQLSIPYSGKNLQVQLYQVNLHADGFRAMDQDRKPLSYREGVFYRGIIKGDLNSIASFSFFDRGLVGNISSAALSNLTIGKLDTKTNTGDYIIYSDAQLKIPNTFRCGTEDKATIRPDEPAQKNALTLRCVSMYLEVDHNIFLLNNSDTTATVNWMEAVFNNVQTLYDNDEINVAVKTIYIWTTNDPYTAGTSYVHLQQFHELQPVFDGDVGQLVAIDEGNGGVAATIDGLCSDSNYSYADVFFAYNTVPLYSWTVEVIAHEFGHLLGSQHTHGCWWNGNNTAIDGCGTTAGTQYTEGSCAIGPIPLPEVGGTVMSYCHLTDTGINFANGFGPQPTARIQQTVNSATCLSTDCINTCISQIYNLIIQSSTADSATVSWSDASAATSWQVTAATYPFTSGVWTTTTQNPYTFTDLASNSYFRFLVRPVCTTLEAAPRATPILPTQNADFCAGLPFLDSGGLGSNYSDMENWVRTILPLNNTDKITVAFSSLDLEAGYDYLYVYDGPDLNSSLLTPAGLNGTTLQGPFTSTHPSGALTFKFHSDEYVNGAGWNAALSCESLGIPGEEYLDYSYFPNPASGTLTLRSKNTISDISVYAIDGKLWYHTKGTSGDNVVNMAAFASGTYVFKLEIEGHTTAFRIIKP